MARKIQKNKKINYIALSSIFIILCVVFLSIGWSAFQTTLNTGNLFATVRVDRDVRITGVRIESVTSSATSNYEEYNVNEIYTSVYLPNSTSSVTYEVVVANLGNVEVGIRDITGLPSNLKYTLNNYTLESVLCDDTVSTKCKLGSISTISITIEYDTNGYNANTTSYLLDLDFDFVSIDWVARIGNNRFFESLQEAITAVPTDGTQTTVVLLKDTSEYLEVDDGRNVVLDLQNFTVNSTIIGGTGKPVLEIWNGIVTMTNGTFNCTAGQAAVNVWDAEFHMSGGTVNTTGSKQALYNSGGLVTISGTAVLHNTNSSRPAVQNHDPNGTIIITGGTIIADRHAAVQNEAGTLRIGTNDGTISTTPVLQGGTYAVNNSNVITPSSPPANIVITNFEFYDGVLYGKTNAIYNDGSSYVTIPTGYGIYYENEIISNATYQKGTLAIVNEVTFDPNQGTVGETLRRVKTGTAIGTLPTPQRTDYVFDGWFYSNGTEAKSSDIVNSDFTLTAMWTHVSSSYVAQIGTTKYPTLADAIASITTSTPTTIELLKSTSENVTINTGRDITLDLKSFTLSGVGNPAVIVVNGKCTLISGRITTSSSNTAAINVTGNFIMTGGSIEALGARQAIYNDGGTVRISGSAYLSASTSIRATVQNHTASGTIYITGGTIVSLNYSAVYVEAGTVEVGSNDGTIDATTPVLRGAKYGAEVKNKTTFNFYDGKLMGIQGIVSGTIADHAGSYVDTTETVGSDTYYVRYLN